MRYCSSPLQNNHSAEAFPHALNSEGALTFCFFSPAKYPLSLVPSSSSFSSHLLYSYPSYHLSLLGSFPFSTEIPSISMENTPPHYFSCTYEASSLPSVFSSLHHQESIWIRGGLQGTQTKAQNGPTTLPKTDLELMGLSHVGFGSQNYQNQCFTPADSMNRLNRLNRMPTGRTDCKKF